MQKKYVWMLFLGILPANTQAGPLTLDALLGTVRATHPAISMARQETLMTRQQKKAEAWIEDPEIEFMAEEIPYMSPSPGNASMQKIGVMQKIPFPALPLQKAKSFNKEIAAKKSMTDAAERDAVFDAKKSYYELVAADQQIREYGAIISSYKQMLGSMETAYSTAGGSTPDSNATGGGGMGGTTVASGSAVMPQTTLADVYMVKMKKAEAEAELHDMHHQRHALVAKINLLMQREPSTKISLVTPRTKSFRGDENALWEKTKLQNSEITAMRHYVSKAKSDVKVAKYSVVPGLGLTFEHDRRQNMDNAYTLSVGLNVPLWINRNAGTIGMAKADKLRAEASLENTTLTVREEFHYLVEHAKWHGKILGKYRGEILPNAKAAADAALALLQTGMAPSSTVLDKIIGAAQARIMYWKMWGDYMIEYAMLEKLVGEDL